jgi:hypothetical protein
LAARGGDARFDSIDPTDILAVEEALMNAGFSDVRRTQLKNEAIRLNSIRLAAAQDIAAKGNVHTRAAHEDAVAQAEAQAENRGGTAPISPADRKRD